jgi:hypothetical protein
MGWQAPPCRPPRFALADPEFMVHYCLHAI